MSQLGIEPVTGCQCQHFRNGLIVIASFMPTVVDGEISADANAESQTVFEKRLCQPELRGQAIPVDKFISPSYRNPAVQSIYLQTPRRYSIFACDRMPFARGC